jgi:hypothetical protein
LKTALAECEFQRPFNDLVDGQASAHAPLAVAAPAA